MSSTGTQEAVEAIEALRAQWPQHFNDGRISELGQLFYAPEAFALPGEHDAIRGRDNITAFLREIRDSGDVHFELDAMAV